MKYHFIITIDTHLGYHIWVQVENYNFLKLKTVIIFIYNNSYNSSFWWLFQKITTKSQIEQKSNGWLGKCMLTAHAPPPAPLTTSHNIHYQPAYMPSNSRYVVEEPQQHFDSYSDSRLCGSTRAYTKLCVYVNMYVCMYVFFYFYFLYFIKGFGL